MKKIFGIIVLSLFTFALASCEQLETEAVGFSQETLTLEVGTSAFLELNNPRDLSLNELAFTSENVNVATVTSSGGVVARGEGVTAVTLTYAGVVVDFVLIHVYDPDGIAVDGREVVIRIANNYIQWAYDGETQWNDLVSLFALTGSNGREIELNTSETHIQWRYVGSSTWTNLVALSLLIGEDGVSVTDVFFREVFIEGEYDYAQREPDVDMHLISDEVYLAWSEDYRLGLFEDAYDRLFDEGVTNTFFNAEPYTFTYGDDSEVNIYYSGYGSGDEYGYEYFNISGGRLSDYGDFWIVLENYEDFLTSGTLYTFSGAEVEAVLYTFDADSWEVYEVGDDFAELIFIKITEQELRLIENTGLFYQISLVTDAYSDASSSFELVFELSNGEEIAIDYTEILNESFNIEEAIEELSDQIFEALNEIEESITILENIATFNLYSNMINLVYNALLNSPNNGENDYEFLNASVLNYTNGDYDADDFYNMISGELGYIDELNPVIGEGGYLYLSRDTLFGIAMLAASCIIADLSEGEGSLFAMFMCDDYEDDYYGDSDSYTVIDLLAIMLGLTYDDYSEGYNGDADYNMGVSPTLLYEYLLLIDSFDETLYFQYLLDNPFTGWDLFNIQDRLHFNRALANNALNVTVFLDLTVTGLADLLNYDWAFGGDEGLFIENYQSLEVGVFEDYSYLNVSGYFSTPSVINFYNRFAEMDDTFVTFSVPFGAAFPLPTEFHMDLELSSPNRSFVLDGYEYLAFAGYSSPTYVQEDVHGDLENDDYVTYEANYYDIQHIMDFSALFHTYFNTDLDIFDIIPYNNGSPFLFIRPILTEVFTVTFTDGDSDFEVIERVRSGNTVTLPTSNPSRTGYEFIGWELNGNSFTSSTPVTANITVDPTFDVIEYNINYNDLDFNETNNNATSYNIEDGNITLTAPSNIEPGYEFKRWEDADGNEVTSIPAGSTGDIELYAVIDLIEYTVTYIDDEDYSHDNINLFDATELGYELSDASKTGYNFDGWFTAATGGSQVFSLDELKDWTLHARFTPITYTITFDANNGTGVDPADIQADYDEDVTIPGNPYERTGYNFVDWNTDPNGNGDSYGSGVTDNLSSTDGATVTLYAQWEEDVMIVTYSYVVDGTDSNNDEFTINELPYTLSDATAEGYEFLGWFTTAAIGGTEVTSITEFDDVTIHARFRAINYAVTVDIVSQTGDASFTLTGRPNTGQTMTITLTPETGFVVSGVRAFKYPSINGVPTKGVEIQITGSYTFTMPAENVLIEVSLEVLVLRTFNTSYTSGTNVPISSSTFFISNRNDEFNAMVRILDEDLTSREGIFNQTLQDFLDSNVIYSIEITIIYFDLVANLNQLTLTYDSTVDVDYQAIFDLINTNNEYVVNNDVRQTRVIVIFNTAT